MQNKNTKQNEQTEGILEMFNKKPKDTDKKEEPVVDEVKEVKEVEAPKTEEKVDWKAKYEALEATQKDAPAPQPVSEGMSVHAYSHDGQLDVDNLDPNYHYRWVSKMDKKLKTLNSMNVNRKRGKGYEIVTSDSENGVSGPSMGGSTVETHDLILMRTSKEQAAAIQKGKIEQAKAAIRNSDSAQTSKDFEGSIKHGKQSYDTNLQMMDDSDNIFSE